MSAPPRRSVDPVGPQTQRNIRAVCELERQALERRSKAERLSDLVANQAGRIWFILLHAVWFSTWIFWNGGLVQGLHRFDPFPFPALTTVVSLEAIFLSLFILMSQNRTNRHADERTHLDLQVNLLAEHETTKMLQLLQAVCAYHKLPEALDTEVEQLLRTTKPEQLARELKDHLPSEQK